MGTKILAIGKIRKCGKCKKTKVFYKEQTSFYHCETCGSILNEAADGQGFNEREQNQFLHGTGRL